MEEFHSDMMSDSEEELRGLIRRRMRIGGTLCVIAPLLIFSMFFTRYTFPGNTTVMVLMALIAIGFLGMMIVLYYGTGSSMLFSGMKILRQISPPEPVIEGKLAVLNKDPVYAFAQWGSNTLFFVAFYQSERTFDLKVRVPKAIWKWEYSHPIGEIEVARREGDFTIPVDKDTYYKGRGILYSLLLEEKGIVTMPKTYSAEQLNQIVRSLSQEVIGSGSNNQQFDDDFE